MAFPFQTLTSFRLYEFNDNNQLLSPLMPSYLLQLDGAVWTQVQ